MSAYEILLRERVNMRIDDLYNLDKAPEAYHPARGTSLWENWHGVLTDTSDMSIKTLEQICIELACQMFAFSSKRASHLPILSAFRDREECEREERAILSRIKAGCEE